MTDQDQAAFPIETADRISGTLARFLKIEAAAGGLLLLSTVLALILANTAFSAPFLAFWQMPIGLQFGAFDFTRSIQHWINDGLMTLFFFVVSLELKREFVLGELQDLRTAALPLAAALGGMIVPASFYLGAMAGQPGMHGWGTVMATDTAFVIGALALFGRRIPQSLRVFLISLAIFDDIGAILVVAIGYGDSLNLGALALAVLALCTVAVSARIGIRSIPIYVLFGGLVWLSFDASGLHATIAGVILGLMTPTRVWVVDERMRAFLGRVLARPLGEHWSGNTSERHDLRDAGRAIKESLSPLERLEIMLHPWVGFLVIPLFALANAGVAVTAGDFGQRLSFAIFAGLVFGKPIGVLVFSWVAGRLGLARMGGELSWPLLTAGAFLTGIGFTMSLFIANLAYDPALLAEAKLGILIASATSAIIGILLLAWLSLRKQAAQP
ncbi:Na+/H+ antiporter NhaA [Pelagerythrobacter aerophilus]